MSSIEKCPPLLPQQNGAAPASATRTGPNKTWWLVLCSCLFAWCLFYQSPSSFQQSLDRFYFNITDPTNICSSPKGPASAPKRSFFWFFEAENDAEKAPIILTIGGGPGTSGLINPLLAQGPCLAAKNGTVPNPNRWTEHFNLLALDHPVGAGASYGTLVNNSRDAAIDVYDFLQKFFVIYPHLIGNQFVLSGGSYGGMYIPHIATVIHEQNIALAAGKGQPGAVHINLESMMLSNPLSVSVVGFRRKDAISHFGWILQHRCYNVPDMYNTTTCAELFQVLPTCLEAIQLAQQQSAPEPRVAAMNLCGPLVLGDRHGTVLEDVRKKCNSKDQLDCLPPSFGWVKQFFQRQDIKHSLGIPDFVDFQEIAINVNIEFSKYGDVIQPAYLLYEPLLKDGIRLLHYIGAQDANCAWPGIISFLRLLQSPFQEEFLRAPDVPWPTADSEDATIRVVGDGAGNMTYILVQQAGHFVAHDQPELVKSIVEHWVRNVAFDSNPNP
ncbi:Alpha/Beta hydrolase protein [Favolaschia claudopus]|uniref:carboxypeptidase C n=1 Tax=Favolaschia claudopus TaxID=2862362 RepID=A0AAW0DD29_9AGAR